MSSLTPADAARTRIASVSAITGSVTITSVSAVFTPITAVAAISIAARTSIPSVSPVSVTATVTTVATITVCPCRSAEYSGRQRGRYSEYDYERSQ
ncbi:hypothetical protein WKH71_08555 [Pantoea agglomerans]|uniref:hypothetical protein n=1 Tax=Enterobacter agglomerans TaxID=549 RepID=UPI003C7BE7F3